MSWGLSGHNGMRDAKTTEEKNRVVVFVLFILSMAALPGVCSLCYTRNNTDFSTILPNK
jgi:hypothetical protein